MNFLSINCTSTFGVMLIWKYLGWGVILFNYTSAGNGLTREEIFNRLKWRQKGNKQHKSNLLTDVMTQLMQWSLISESTATNLKLHYSPAILYGGNVYWNSETVIVDRHFPAQQHLKLHIHTKLLSINWNISANGMWLPKWNMIADIIALLVLYVIVMRQWNKNGSNQKQSLNSL